MLMEATPLQIAQVAAISIEDYAITDVASWGGGVNEFGQAVRDVLIQHDRVMPQYLALICHLHKQSQVGKQPEYLVKCAVRAAAHALVMKRALDEISESAKNTTP